MPIPTLQIEGLLMPHILECVKAVATLGEIIGVLRDAWGEHVEPRGELPPENLRR